MSDTPTPPADPATTAAPAGAPTPAAPVAPDAPQTPAAPAAPAAPTDPPAPIRVPDDHPLVTALAAQKSKAADLQAKVDQIPATVADGLRSHLIAVHQIDEATASTLITGTTPDQVLAQVAAITGLTGHKATAPRMGTTTTSPASDAAAFVGKLFAGNDS
ncbi:MAG: hypothetical protein QM662_04905 [Gordonia sp. (in: high G+C Gram-positive bacteria)]